MNIRRWLKQEFRMYYRRRNWRRFVQAMAMIVVFCTTYALILPALTMETNTVCGLAEHTHAEGCYDTASLPECTLPEREAHTHGDACYTQSTVCGKEEQAAHSHSVHCIGPQATLICKNTAAEHDHVATCYIYRAGLTCGREETEGHSHTDGCFRSSLSCGLEETEGHSHASDPTDPIMNLVCILAEHTHDDSCYPETEPETTEEPTEEAALPEGDPNADLETPEDWEAGLSAVTFTGGWSEDLLKVARSQLGYGESRENYILDENGTAFGYTRYGQWYGEPYGNWSAMFVSFCLHYAKVEGIGPEQDSQVWLETLNGAEMYREAAAYTPAAGDLIFFDRDFDGVCDRVGIAESVIPAGESGFGSVQVIAGDWNDRVERFEMLLEDASILGYCPLPAQPDAPEHTHSDEAGTQTQVILSRDTTVPADAALTVAAVTEDDAQYAAMAEQIHQALNGTVKQMTLLDISFYDAAGEYLSVSDTAQVSIHFAGDRFPSGMVKVFHFVDGAAVELEKINVSHAAVAAEDGTESVQTQLTFETNGFSVFAVVEVTEGEEIADASSTLVTDLSGEYYIARKQGNSLYALLAQGAKISSGVHDGLKISGAIADAAGLDNYTVWTFHPVAPDTAQYKISAVINGAVKYIQAVRVDNQFAELFLVDSEADASIFNVEQHIDQSEKTVLIRFTKDGNNYYINPYGGAGSATAFIGYNESHGGSLLSLYTKVGVPAPDLGGKQFALVSNAEAKAITTSSATVNGVPGLASRAVTFTETNGTRYVEGDIPVWTFEETATPGVYHISTEVAGGTKYLRMLDRQYNNGTDGRGSLSLDDEAQDVRVMVNDDGTVYLTCRDTYGNTGYINLDQGVGAFWTYNAPNPVNKLLLCSIKESSFAITYNGYTITVNLQDADGNPIYTDRVDYAMSAGELLQFADHAPVIDGYKYAYAIFNNNIEVSSVESNVNGNAFRVYESDYTEGSTKFYTRNQNIAVTFVYENDRTGLRYNLNAPAGATWINAPSIPKAFQSVSADGAALLSVAGGNEIGSFVDNTLSGGARSDIVNYYDAYNNSLGTNLTPENYRAPGAEYRFQGWKATVDGADYLFPENATATVDSDGYIHIVDVDGTERILPPNTTLTGQWKQLSDVVLFFVNYSDTMLATEDNQEIGSNGASYYTDVVAIGHIFDPVTVSPGPGGNHGTILKSNDALIQAQIVPKYDPSITTTQIVIDAVAQFNDARKDFEYVTVNNYNQIQLEAAVSQYLQNDSNDDTQVKIDGAYVDKSQITAENYKLYWYKQILEYSPKDGWHIDGVLVAKTQPLEIYKTFSGLTDDETDEAINSMTFPLGLINTDGEKGEYTTLTANSSQEGVYTNDGQQGSSHIYKWTLQAVQGQRYAFAEEEYLVDDHDWSGLISVHYTDGFIDYWYNTDTTYDDTKNTDLFANKPIIGGEVESVIFANFYTKTGTGMFSVSKVQEDNDRNRLSGAVFTLKDENGQVVATETTNDNGAVHFADLKVGTYTLEETQAPTGYQKVNTKWTVKVSKSGSGVTVEIWEEGKENSKTTLYDSKNGGIKEVYLVENEPESTTVTVNKYFTGITDTEVKQLTGYCIQVQNSDGTVEKTLTLADATLITGAINGYTWTIDLECENDYTFVESSYSHRNYLDTVVTATVNGSAAQVTKSNNNTVASFPMTKSEAADTVNITNDYTNTFLLRIHKVDATNNNADMKDVMFHIYGDFQFHVTPPEGVADTVDYTDANGNTQTAHYIGTTEETDANGMTQFVDMHLSTGSNSFLYVINEANTPDGYLKLDEPIVRVVEVNGGDPSYNNGVYTLTVENHKEAQATVAVTAEKLWSVPEGMDCPPVTLTLYQETADGTVTQISQVTLDGTTNSQTTENGITATVNGWQVVWSGLTYAYGDSRNEFYVSESALPGYITTYSTKVSTLKVGTSQVGAAIAEGYNLKRSVTVTNTAGYELPSTGGSGTIQLTLGGLAMFLGAAYLLYGERKRRKGKA